MIKNKIELEKHIVGENGIGYTLGKDDLYYPDLKLPGRNALQHRQIWSYAVRISEKSS